MKIIRNIDVDKVQDYLIQNKDRTIQEVYDFIKSKKLRHRSTEEHLIFAYLNTYKKELGIK